MAGQNVVLGFTVLREVRAEKKHDWVDKALVYNVMVVLGLHSPGCDHSLICNHYSKQLHQRVLGLGIFFFFQDCMIFRFYVVCTLSSFPSHLVGCGKLLFRVPFVLQYIQIVVCTALTHPSPCVFQC